MTTSTDITNILNGIGSVKESINNLNQSELGKEIIKGFNDNIKGNATLGDIKKTGESVKKILENVLANQDVNTDILEKTIDRVTKELQEIKRSGVKITKEAAIATNVQVIRNLQNSVSSNGTPIINTANSPMLQDLKQNVPLLKGPKATDTEKDQDSFMEKLKTFWGTTVKKSTKGFISDLVTELGNTKLIKGGFTDLIKLVSYLGASWLRQFGTMGKVLGVALIAAGPVLAGLLGKVIGSAFKSATSWLWDKIAKGLLQKAGAGISNWMWNSKSPLAQGMLNVSTMSTGAKVAMAAQGAAAIGLGVNAVNAWKEGHRGEAIASGVGAAGFGISALAPLLPFLAPIAPIALGVGAVAAGVTLFVKYQKQILDFLKKTWDFIFAPIKNVFDWLKENWPWGDKGGGTPSAVNSGQKIGFGERVANLFPGSTNRNTVKTYGKVQVGEDGAILNADSLSQAELKTGVEQYRKEDPERFNRVYEIGSSDVASLGSFRNDAIAGGGALLYKGASADLNSLKQALAAGGMSEDKAKALLYTSGLSTKGSGHKKGGWKSHSNIYGLATDIAGSGWSQSDYALAMPIIKEYYKQRGFVANYEVGGKFTDPSKAYGAGVHVDIKPMKNVRTEGAVLNQKDLKQKVSSEDIDLRIKNGETSSSIEDKPKYQSTMADKPTYSTPISELKEKKNKKVASIGKSLDYTGNESSSFLLQTGLNIINLGTEAFV